MTCRSSGEEKRTGRALGNDALLDALEHSLLCSVKRQKVGRKKKAQDLALK